MALKRDILSLLLSLTLLYGSLSLLYLLLLNLALTHISSPLLSHTSLLLLNLALSYVSLPLFNYSLLLLALRLSLLRLYNSPFIHLLPALLLNSTLLFPSAFLLAHSFDRLLLNIPSLLLSWTLLLRVGYKVCPKQ